MTAMARAILLLNTLILLVGVALMAFFVSRGAEVDAEGLLVEEFWAWGIGIWLVIASLVGYLIWGIVRLIAWWRSR